MNSTVDTPAVYGEMETMTKQLHDFTGYDIIVQPLNGELLGQLELFCDEHNATLFVALLAAFKVLLSRYNDDENIGMWHVTSAPGMPQMLQLAVESIGEVPFTTLLSDVRKAVDAASETAAPDEAMECKAMFVMRQDVEPMAYEYAPIVINGRAYKTDIEFIVSDSWRPEVIVKFRKDVYTSNRIQQMTRHFVQLLVAILKNPDQKTGALPILTGPEKHEILDVFNGTLQHFPEDKTLVDLFEMQVCRKPGNTAVCMDDRSMTYDELNRKSNQLARHLLACGVGREDNVALLATRGFDLIVGIFAILKSGAAYVPIEPEYPVERQQYILKQSEVKFVVTNIRQELGDLVPSAMIVDMNGVRYENYKSNNPRVDTNSRQLAYTIYTSGSTGVPKGVMVEHRSAVNLITWVNKTFNVGEHDCMLFVTSVCFDLSVYDIFGILAAGGSIAVAEKKDMANIPKLIEYLDRFNITFWNSVPSTMEYFLRSIAATDPYYRQNTLRLVFLSGDWIPVNLPDNISVHFPDAKVVSLGGATEGTVWSNYFPIEPVSNEWQSIPYGCPIANNSFYILNDQLQPVPPGVIGELYIGGVGVARGYANDGDKTQNAFLSNPFAGKVGGKMYRTGDMGRMRADYTMELIGRKDNQVKIRGHRVELGEIEFTIRQLEMIKSVIVLYNGERKQLIAFIVPGEYYDLNNVTAYLKTKLPDYMFPAKWIELDSIPLTANGKIDTKALLEMNTDESLQNKYIASTTETEKSLVAVWQQVLEIGAVGINDNFFELGGHSLLAVELICEMEKIVNKLLPVNILYKHPTIKEIAAFVQVECLSRKWKSLVAIKPDGNKIPIYILPGDGLSLSNFYNLSRYVDKEQPVYSLQPIGLDGTEEPLDNIAAIAKSYIRDILAHNPSGPYALAGYSFGGYVAIEIKKQLEQMGKKVKMLAIFDTDAENVIYKKDWKQSLPRRIKRQIPKFLFIVKSMFKRPIPTMKYQYKFLKDKIANFCYSLGIWAKPQLKGIHSQISKINETHLKAFRNYHLTSFNDKIYLFKAKHRIYFVDDFEHLGWTNYAQKGVCTFEVPGDHRTMFLPPNVGQLARMLQNALDNC